MATTATNVTVGKPKVGGAVHWAPLGTTLPTDATTAIASVSADYVDLGYVSEDGLTNNNSPESDTVKAWGGDTVLNLQTDRPDTFALTLIEAMNEDVLKTIYGASNIVADGSGNITVKATAQDMPSGVWVFDMILKGGRAKRIVVPNGTISELGEIAYKDSEAVGYNVTITDVPDTNGVYHYEYITATAPSA
jgi:hypothetical protein